MRFYSLSIQREDGSWLRLLAVAANAAAAWTLIAHPMAVVQELPGAPWAGRLGLQPAVPARATVLYSLMH